MKIPNPLHLQADSPDLLERVAALQKVAGIYVLRSETGVPHLSWSTNLGRRFKRLLLTAHPSAGSLLNRLRSQGALVDYWRTGSRLESALLLYQLAKQYFPDNYLKLLKLRIPWFVALADGHGFARLEVTNRLSRKGGTSLGPFASRAVAEQYEQQILSLFQIRRCTEVLAPHHGHPGCIYGEMNQCLRPCQCAVTADEYDSEALRVQEFLQNNGRSNLAAMSAARDRACEELQFEQAAQLHKRIERIKATSALRDNAVGEIHEFGGVALTASAIPGELILWPMLQGYWQEPIPLTFLADEARARSLDEELRQLLTERLATPRVQGKRAEELAIFSRWYYSTWRDGQWFSFRHLGSLNYRQLVRGLSKMKNQASPQA